MRNLALFVDRSRESEIYHFDLSVLAEYEVFRLNILMSHFYFFMQMFQRKEDIFKNRKAFLFFQRVLALQEFLEERVSTEIFVSYVAHFCLVLVLSDSDFLGIYLKLLWLCYLLEAGGSGLRYFVLVLDLVGGRLFEDFESYKFLVLLWGNRLQILRRSNFLGMHNGWQY